MKKSKKWIAAIVSIVMVLTLFGGVAMAQEPEPSMEPEPTESASAEPLPEESTDPIGSAEPAPAESVEPTEESSQEPEPSVSAEPEEAGASVQPVPRMAMAPLADDGVNTAEEFKAALEAGGEVELTGSFEISEKMDIVITKPVTLKLNGFTVTKTYGEINHYFMVIQDGGSLTLEDSGGGKLAATDSSYGYGIQLGSSGTLIVNGGALEATQEVICNRYGASGVTLKINGGSILCTGHDSALSLGSAAGMEVDITGGTVSAENGKAIFATGNTASGLKLNISGGTLTSEDWAVYVDGGVDVTVSGSAVLETTGFKGAVWLDGSDSRPSALKITGGTIKGDYIAVDAEGTSKITMTGGTITTNRATAMEVSEEATAAISGGTLTGADGKTALAGGTDKITVTGGTFSSDVKEYVPDGITITQDGEGNWIVTRLDAVYLNGTSGKDTNSGADTANAVKTLGKALELVADGGTVYICGTVTVDTSAEVSGIKFARADGYTGQLFSVSGAGVELTLADVAIDGKNIDCAKTSYLVFVTNGATLNIKDGTELINNHATAVYVNVGSFLNMSGGAVKNNTISSPASDGAYYGGAGIDNCGTTNITGGEISGNEVSGYCGGGILNGRGTVTISGGAEVKNNSASWGAGIVVLEGAKTVLDGGAVSGNEAEGNGGGIYLEGFTNYDGTPAVFEMKSGSVTENISQSGTGAGIFGYYNDGETIVRISGGTVAGNQSIDEDIGHGITLAGTDSNYAKLELSGSPNISGDVFFRDDYPDGFVIDVTGEFTPAAPVEINRSNSEYGMAAVEYAAGLTPDPKDFTSGALFDGLVADGQTLKWAEAEIVYFYDEDGTEFSEYRHGVVQGEKIDPDNVPAPERAGYTLAGWKLEDGEALWDFDTDVVSARTKLYAVWTLNAPTVSVKADAETVHAGTITLTAEASHDLTGAAYTYQWYKDGEALAGETGDTLTVSESGSYLVKAAASDGTKTSDEAESEPIVLTVEGHVFGPDWKSDETGHWQECACGEKTEAEEHMSDGGVVTTEPTTVAEGVKTYSCTVCGRILRTETIPPTVKTVYYKDAATGVILNTDTTKVPEGSYLLVKPVAETEQAHADAKEALKDKAGRFVLYDITLVNAAGEPIQPAGDVLIGIPTPDGYDTSKLAVHRINEDKTTVEHGVTVQDGVSYFQTDHFSKYALIEKGSMSGAGTDDTAKDEGADSSDTPKTGDRADMTPYILLVIAAGAAVAAAVIVTMRKRRQYEK